MSRDGRVTQGAASQPMVRVRLFGELARYSGGRGYSFDWPLPGDASIDELIAAIGIPAAEVWMVALNGVKTTGSTRPVAGDEVMIFSPVGGG